MITDTTIREVSERANCVSVVGRFVDLKKAGTLFKGLCPFHEEKTPSFTVSPLRNTYHCFGCGAHGDAIRFLMEIGGRSFPESVKELAEEFGVEIVEDRSVSPKRKQKLAQEKDERKRLYTVQDRVATFFTQVLFSNQGGLAQRYLDGRGIDPNAATAFRLGYCPGNAAVVANFVEEAGITLDEMASLGIITRPDNGFDRQRPLGGGYLRFRERLVCPIVDIKDQVVGFSCRILVDNKKSAKYVNSPETPIFVKGEQLYGASTAKKPARQADTVIVCEGNLDVITLWEFGFKASVAVMGTALTDYQGLLLRRLGKQITVIMDGDSAGQKAAFNGLSSFLRAGLQPRAVTMPDGEDPDSYLRAHGADALQERIESAQPLLEIFMDACIAKHPNDDPGKLAAVREISKTLLHLDDELSKRLYIQRLHSRLELSIELIEAAMTEASVQQSKQDLQETETQRRQRAQPTQRSVTQIPEPPIDLPEFRPFTGQTGPEESIFLPTENVRIEFPGYLSQIFGFILQFPSISLDFHTLDGHKFLTQNALIGFLGVLRQSVADGQTPNVDRILSIMTCSQTVAFLRACQAREPTADEESVKAELPNLIKTLALNFLTGERKRLQAELRQAYEARDARCDELRKELREVQERLAKRLNIIPEGA